MTYTDVFKRKEVKYLLDAEQFAVICAGLAEHMEIDAYGRSLISSMYYDTPNCDLICRSLEKPLYKEKLRLRTYGQRVTEATDAEAFLEIKKKYKGIVYKRRVCISTDAARTFMGGKLYEQAVAAHPLPDPEKDAASTSPRSLQIAAELRQFINAYAPLRPSIMINVERTAWALREGEPGDLRITFDEDVRYRNMMQVGTAEHPLLETGQVIMEIKSCQAMPLWLVRLLNQTQAYPTSFSKYGEAYKTVRAASAFAQAS